MTCGTEGNWADGVKQAVRTKLAPILLEQALTLVPALKAKDIDEERLAKAKAEEAAASEAYQEAQ